MAHNSMNTSHEAVQPFVTQTAAKRLTGIFRLFFPGSSRYWESRYAKGGDSGAGSYGRLASFKASVLNAFATENHIHSVMEFGCGDGHQISLSQYEDYTGIDVSPTAVEKCRARFADDPSKRFLLLDDYAGQQAELTLSLDVIFHLVEDNVFDSYMRRLFAAAQRYVIIYSSDKNVRKIFTRHVRHRKFSRWVETNAPGWTLLKRIPNVFHGSGNGPETSFADFFIYTRKA